MYRPFKRWCLLARSSFYYTSNAGLVLLSDWEIDFVKYLDFVVFLQTDMTAEEKRKERQRELREEMNREALERLKQAKEKTSKTKSVHFGNLSVKNA